MLSENHYLELIGGKLSQNGPDNIVGLFNSLEKASTSNHLVVHLHGGLVSRSMAEQTAEDLLPDFEASGAYPIFFLWHSDLWTVLTQNLEKIGQEPIFRRLMKRLVQLALAKLANYAGARAGGILELEELDALPNDLESLEKYASLREPDGSKLKEVTLSRAMLADLKVNLGIG
jgi:hypothetical protein